MFEGVFRFGSSIAVERYTKSYTSDGITTKSTVTNALIGANGTNDLTGKDAGSAYIISKPYSSGWGLSAAFKPDGGDTQDRFGDSVAISRDTALIGAPGDASPNGENAGSAFVYTEAENEWTQQAKLVPADGESGDSFGSSVALVGDTALVGAPGMPNAIPDWGPGAAGVVYVFTREDGTWSQQAKLTANDVPASDSSGGRGNFGTSLEMVGDTAFIGAHFAGITEGETSSGRYPGAAYVFTRSEGTWSQQAKLTGEEDAEYDDHFGWSIAAASETSVIIGAPKYKNSDHSAGAAFVFTQSDGTWSQAARLTPDDGVDDDLFGWSVALRGDAAIVGAIDDTPGTSESEATTGEGVGAAYLFKRRDGTWDQQMKYPGEEVFADYADIGSAVALTDNRAFVGEREDRQGVVYVLE